MSGLTTGVTVLSETVEFSASDAARLAGGELVGADVTVTGASFDTRTLTDGALFVAVEGERDGHDFLSDAVERGAALALVRRHIHSVNIPQVVVGDTVAAFGLIAHGMRSTVLSHASVIGITGSVGKTSVKDLAAAALGEGGVVASPQSFNNDQGVPFTVLNAPADTQHLVLEMGMRGLGEIARLCAIAQPTIGVITRVGEAHTERLGGLAGVAIAKSELVESLDASGFAILNAEDPLVAAMDQRTRASVVRFGVGGDVTASDLMFDEQMRARCIVLSPWGSVPLVLPVPGEHMVSNALAALTVAGVSNGSIEEAAARLENAQISQQRLSTSTLADGSLLIDDTYNANPTSVEAALRTLAGVRSGHRVAVLGAMAEVSEPSVAHRRMADLAGSLGIDVIAVGTDLYGVEPESDPIGRLHEIQADHRGDVAILVKASRSSGLEWVAERLRMVESVKPAGS